MSSWRRAWPTWVKGSLAAPKNRAWLCESFAGGWPTAEAGPGTVGTVRTTRGVLNMPKRHGRILGSLAAILAAGLAGFSLRPSPQPVTAVASRNPAEVKTQVIRRTIHIVHHQGAGHGAGRHGGPSASGRPAPGTVRGVRTGASRSHAGGSTVGSGGTAAAPVATRTSGSHAASAGSSGSLGGSSGAPVTTRTSASHPSPGSSASHPSSGSPGASPSPVRTRTSGSHAPSGSPAAGAGTGSKPVTSRTSGGRSGGGEDKGDHGD